MAERPFPRLRRFEVARQQRIPHIFLALRSIGFLNLPLGQVSRPAQACGLEIGFVQLGTSKIGGLEYTTGYMSPPQNGSAEVTPSQVAHVYRLGEVPLRRTPLNHSLKVDPDCLVIA